MQRIGFKKEKNRDQFAYPTGEIFKLFVEKKNYNLGKIRSSWCLLGVFLSREEVVAEMNRLIKTGKYVSI